MNLFQLSDQESFAAGIDVSISAPSFALQKLENFTILFICQGNARLEVDFQRYDLQPRQVMKLLPNQFFQCLEVSVDFRVSYITFTPAIMHEITVRFDPSFFAFLKQYPLSPPLTADKAENHRHLLQAVYDIYMERTHTFRLPIFKNFLQNFLMEIYDKTKALFLHRNAANTSRQEELLEKFISFVFQHSGTQREVQFYADQLCITTRYLSSVIQHLTGHTPKELIDIRCIQEIKMQLRTTNKTMQEIAFELDFPDQSFFARYFKKHTGLTPVAYRAQKTEV